VVGRQQELARDQDLPVNQVSDETTTQTGASLLSPEYDGVASSCGYKLG
jgi:hypothetical protein